MKSKRQKKIIDIIEGNPIPTQEELAEALRQAGIEVTQATVSRDIKELRLVKVSQGNDTYRYAIPKETAIGVSEEKLKRMIRDFVTGVDYSENLIVIRTYPGNAHGVASLIDGANWEQIIGTVAGDDTILLIIKPITEVQNVIDKVKSMME